MSPNPPFDRTPAGPVRVFLMAGDPLVSAGLGRLLEERGDAIVVADPADAEVALWDAARRGDRDGAVSAADLELIADLPVPIVALVADEAESAVALSAGARGAILRNADPASLWAALIAARAGLLVVDVAFTQATGAGGGAVVSARARGGLGDLTGREREVLGLLSRGLSNKRIAQRLAISEHTAKFHVNGILGKLGATTRTEAVVIAARQGLVAL